MFPNGENTDIYLKRISLELSVHSISLKENPHPNIQRRQPNVTVANRVI